MKKQWLYAYRAQRNERVICVTGYLLMYVILMIIRAFGVELTENVALPIVSVIFFFFLLSPIALTFLRMSNLLYSEKGYFPALEPVSGYKKFGAQILVYIADAVGATVIGLGLFLPFAVFVTHSWGNGFSMSWKTFATILGAIYYLFTACFYIACALHAAIVAVNRFLPGVRYYGWFWLLAIGVLKYFFIILIFLAFPLVGINTRFVAGLFIPQGNPTPKQIEYALIIQSLFFLAGGAALFLFGARSFEDRLSVRG